MSAYVTIRAVMAFRTALLVSLVVAAGLASSSSAAPPEELDFEASRSAWTEFEVKERLVFSELPRLEGGGRAAGIVV